MPRLLNYPKVVGVRLSEEDGQKLQHLCTAMQRPAGEVLRILVRLAEPTGIAPVRFAAPGEHEGMESVARNSNARA